MQWHGAFIFLKTSKDYDLSKPIFLMSVETWKHLWKQGNAWLPVPPMRRHIPDPALQFGLDLIMGQADIEKLVLVQP